MAYCSVVMRHSVVTAVTIGMQASFHPIDKTARLCYARTVTGAFDDSGYPGR
jgi:hypothetical protein